MNLVPLQLDKDTGRIYATNRGIGNGGGTPPSPGGIGKGYSEQILTPSTVWTVVHNEGTGQIIAQVYDDDRKLIVPDSIEIIDGSTVRITFGSPQTGTVHIIFFAEVI